MSEYARLTPEQKALWTNPKGTVPGDHNVFGSLKPSTNFETLREYLIAYNRDGSLQRLAVLFRRQTSVYIYLSRTEGDALPPS